MAIKSYVYLAKSPGKPRLNESVANKQRTSSPTQWYKRLRNNSPSVTGFSQIVSWYFFHSLSRIEIQPEQSQIDPSPSSNQVHHDN